MIRRHRTYLRKITRNTLRRHGMPVKREAVEDLLQEVWCRVVERWGPRPVFSGADPRARRYLARTARNVTLDQIRRDNAAKRDHRRRCPLGDHRDPTFIREVADVRESPEARLLRREARQSFRRHCAPFTGPLHRQRDLDIVEMAVLDGMSSRHVAETIGRGLSERGVDAVICRMRQRLASHGFTLPSRR